jgi:DNA-binding GntR family transcriptional regulator
MRTAHAGEAAPAAGGDVRTAGEAARQQARQELRRAILAGDMAPGQRLVETELARLFGVTRASMRAALMDLTVEALVERIPNRGARVRVITSAEATEITECRMALEGLCAAKAAELVTESQASRLRKLRKKLISSAGEPLKYSSADSELHRLIRELSGQAIAAGLLEQLSAQLVRHQPQPPPGRARASLAAHLAIIDAIVGRDPAAAEQAARHQQSAPAQQASTTPRSI